MTTTTEQPVAQAGEWGRAEHTGALVCGAEVCQHGAIEDAAAARDGRLGPEAAAMLAQTAREKPHACAYCGTVNFQLYRHNRRTTT